MITSWQGVYLGLFIFGAGFLLLQMLLGQFSEAEPDTAEHPDLDGGSADSAGHDHHTGHDVSFLTPLIIAPTLAGVGAVGLFLSVTWSIPWLLHLPIALVAGLVLGYAIFFVLARILAPMQGSSEVRVSELWGTVAEVITPIPENRLGEIRFIAHGAYHSTAARTVSGEPLTRGQTVIIEKVENAVAHVRPTR